MANPTVIISCTCQSTFQDLTYGKQRRLMNHAPSKGAKPNRYRCTVCKKEHEYKSSNNAQ